MHQRTFKGEAKSPIRIGKARDVSPRVKGLNLGQEKGLLPVVLGRVITGPTTEEFTQQGRAIMPVVQGPKRTMRRRKEATNFRAEEVAKAINKEPRRVKLKPRGEETGPILASRIRGA